MCQISFFVYNNWKNIHSKRKQQTVVEMVFLVVDTGTTNTEIDKSWTVILSVGATKLAWSTP